MIYVDDETFRARNVEGEAVELRSRFWRIEDGDEHVKLIPVHNEDREIFIEMLAYMGEELSRAGRTCKTMSFGYKGVYATLHKNGDLFLNIQEEIRATFHK